MGHKPILYGWISSSALHSIHDTYLIVREKISMYSHHVWNFLTSFIHVKVFTDVGPLKRIKVSCTFLTGIGIIDSSDVFHEVVVPQ